MVEMSDNSFPAWHAEHCANTMRDPVKLEYNFNNTPVKKEKKKPLKVLGMDVVVHKNPMMALMQRYLNDPDHTIILNGDVHDSYESPFGLDKFGARVFNEITVRQNFDKAKIIFQMIEEMSPPAKIIPFFSDGGQIGILSSMVLAKEEEKAARWRAEGRHWDGEEDWDNKDHLIPPHYDYRILKLLQGR